MKLIEKIDYTEYWLMDSGDATSRERFRILKRQCSRWYRLFFDNCKQDYFYEYNSRAIGSAVFKCGYIDHVITIYPEDSHRRCYLCFYDSTLSYNGKEDMSWKEVRGYKRSRPLDEERKIALKNGWVDDCVKARTEPDRMPKEWLECKVTIDEIKRELDNDRLEILKSKMVEGDELWKFRSNDKSWAGLAGCEGIILKRGREEIDCIIF